MTTLNGALAIRGTTMNYVRFGRGEKTLVMLPGLGDGLRTAKSAAFLLSFVSHASLRMYPDYGHSLYEEAKDFESVVLGFLVGG